MKRTMLGFLGTAALVFVGLGACGGKVVIDAEGNGEGGAGAGGSGSAGTNTTTSGTGGGTPKSLCEEACGKLSTIPACADPSCLSGCMAEFANAGDCWNEVTAVIECMTENAGVNGECFSSACNPLLDALEDCKNPSGSCAGLCSEAEDGSCTCEGSCNGSKVSTECFPQPGTTPVCVCSVNGMQVGKCQSTLGTFACGITDGCCAQFF